MNIARSAIPMRVLAAAAAAALSFAAPRALAQINLPEPPEDLRGVDVFEKRGETVPLDIELVNERGEIVHLADFFDGKRPVLLSLVYYNCPMLCKLMLADLHKAVDEQRWELGKDYRVVTLSFDHRNTMGDAQKMRAFYADSLRRPGLTQEQSREGWSFLLASKDNAQAVADSVGFVYRFLPRSGEFSHPTVVMVLTPTGQVSNYLYGRYGTQFDERQLRLSLADAADGKLGTVLERIGMWCYMYDPDAGVYSLQAMRVMQIGGAMTAVAVGALIGGLFWTSRARRASVGAAAPTDGARTDEETPGGRR